MNFIQHYYGMVILLLFLTNPLVFTTPVEKQSKSFKALKKETQKASAYELYALLKTKVKMQEQDYSATQGKSGEPVYMTLPFINNAINTQKALKEPDIKGFIEENCKLFDHAHTLLAKTAKIAHKKGDPDIAYGMSGIILQPDDTSFFLPIGRGLLTWGIQAFTMFLSKDVSTLDNPTIGLMALIAFGTSMSLDYLLNSDNPTNNYLEAQQKKAKVTARNISNDIKNNLSA